MTRYILSPLAVALVCSPIAAELNVVARLEDPRIAERKVYLRHDASKTGEITTITVYLPESDTGSKEKTWELLFETDELLRQAVSIARHSPQGQKIMVRGREVVTLRGRGLLVEYVRSSW